MSHTQAYITALQKEQGTGVAIEHAYRPALKNYLEALLPNVIAINDPKRQKCGAPDYIVRKGELDVGYIEAKDINVSLDKTEKTDQMKRYLESLDNLILTDYLEFRFYRNGQKVDTVRIAELGAFFQMDAPKIKPFPENFEKLETLLADFIGFQGQTIKSPKQLAEMMARKAKLMRDVFAEALKQDDDDNTLRDQWKAFQQILIHDMDEAQFADVYAQTITYGLFTARLHDKTLENFSREEARGLIPRSNPFVRQLFDYVCGANLDDRVVWIVDALCEVYRAADVSSILKSFGRATGRNDPIVHFYEDFLGAYDSKLRKARGVWYTPEPVVNFIVRAVDEVLKTHFKLPDGLADTSKVTIEVDGQGKKAKQRLEVHRVQLLDVAAGTGTFTAEAIKQVYSRFAGQEGMWSSYVEEHLLPRLHGFEILMASYAMCHLKIDLLLQETGYKPKNPQNPPRLGVYLTNALEEYHPDTGTLLAFAGYLANEARLANEIKRDTPIMVAYGNPPYSGVSSNNGKWITDKIEDYKYVDGVHFGERKHWLQDDYVKFIRLAEHYVEKNGHGVLAYITNHGYLDNPTFRGMRWHLLNTFDDIYVLDLHGSSKKKEVAPDGSPDKNVFDIQAGVAIIIAVKHSQRKEKLARVHFADVWGSRASKYNYLWDTTLRDVAFAQVEYTAPNYFFSVKDEAGRAEYETGFSVSAMFPLNVTGIVTMGDGFIVQETRQKVLDNLDFFMKNEVAEPELTSKFDLGKNYAKWIIENKNKIAINSDRATSIDYRPFDTRWTYFDNKFLWRWREEVIRHMLPQHNVGLICPKQAIEEAGGFITKNIIAHKTMSAYNINYLFPLYLYPDASAAQSDLLYSPLAGESGSATRDTVGGKSAGRNPPTASATASATPPQGGSTPLRRKPNLDDKIVAAIAKKLKLPFVPDHDPEYLSHWERSASDSETGEGNQHLQPSPQPSPKGRGSFNPLDLLDYIYAVLHSPKYRSTYKEFLKIDFPRIPYPADAATFWQLVALGGELRALHLLEHPLLSKPITTYPIGGDNIVEKPVYAEGKVHINQAQYFGGVPEVAWNFYIGGYQPAQKWLKDRKGRTLSLDDLRHYAKIIIALTETDRLMKEIDAVWKV
jgi:predicted helicase